MPRVRPILNGDEFREQKDFAAELASVVLDETAEKRVEVDFEAYRPRLEAFGISVQERVERVVSSTPSVGQFGVEPVEPGAVVLQFPFGQKQS